MRWIVTVAVTALALAGCGDGPGAVGAGSSTTASTTSATSPGPTVTLTGTEGTIVSWSMPAGECQDCGFDLRVDADGTVRFIGDRSFGETSVDPARLEHAVSGIDPRTLVIGETDCGREVDGNAPSLRLFPPVVEELVVIDTCYRELDPGHPLTALVLGLETAGRDASVDAVAIVREVGGLCPRGTCETRTAFHPDGTWVREDSEGNEPGGVEVGAFSTADAQNLVRLAGSTSLDDLVAGPDDGECASAVDGQDRVYEIGATDVGFVVSSCGYELAGDAGILVLLHRLLDEVDAAVSD